VNCFHVRQSTTLSCGAVAHRRKESAPGAKPTKYGLGQGLESRATFGCRLAKRTQALEAKWLTSEYAVLGNWRLLQQDYI
jgi:hypothetical protein